MALPWYKTYRVGERDHRGCICPWKITATKRREKKRIVARDRLVFNDNQSSR